MSAKILVIDDSGLARKNLRRMLQAAGHHVVEAQDGMAALEVYFAEKPDVVLLDLIMSGMYGLDVLKKLRQLDPQARVVIISADIQAPSRDLARELGAGAFLSKPVEETEVLSVIDAVLNGERLWS
jgi:two-component system, chemotaxis family, chemotaxis protein CheY